MCIKFIILPLLFTICVSKAFAQLTEGGKMLDAKAGKIEPISFLRSVNPIGNVTKYSIVLSGREIYEVEFAYDKDGDSISIQFYDKHNVTVKRECVKLKSEDSHFLICDFKANVKQIKNTEAYRILFSIEYPNRQFMTLYQFQAIGGIQTQFILGEVPEDIISQHNIAVNDKENIDNIRKSHAASIYDLKTKMILYKDSVIKNILKKEKTKMLSDATVSADYSMSSEFNTKMDNIFINYFRNVFSFNEEVFDIDFIFSCDGYGHIKIDTVKSMVFKSGPQKGWIRDSFMLKVKPEIEKGAYNTLSEITKYPTLKSDFADWFEVNFTNDPNLGSSARDSFAVEQNLVMEELGKYMTRTVNLPTVYTYNFSYASSVKTPVWKYSKENSGEKFIDKSEGGNKVVITEGLKQVFKHKYPGLSNGKYKVKVNQISLNAGKFEGENIVLIEKQ